MDRLAFVSCIVALTGGYFVFRLSSPCVAYAAGFRHELVDSAEKRTVYWSVLLLSLAELLRVSPNLHPGLQMCYFAKHG